MSPMPHPKIAGMAPYALADLSAPEGVPRVSMAQNESLRPPSPLALEAARRALADGALYPDPDWSDLRSAIAEVHGVAPGHVLCGAGSMELIGAIAHTYLGPGDRASTTAHGYLFFRTATALAGAEVDLAPERDLCVDVDALLATVAPDTRVVFVANPGNPTGTAIGREALMRLREGLPRHVLLVIDEAYGEFYDGPDIGVFDLVGRGDTVVLRTFSKAYGLAGLRVGWGSFPAAVGAEVRKVLNPNNISGPAQAAASAAMRDQEYMRETVALTAKGRDRFADRARSLGLEVPPSRTNFALLRFRDPAAARAADGALRAKGVLLRAMAGYGLPDCLRATIGPEEHMSLAVDTLEAVSKTEVAR